MKATIILGSILVGAIAGFTILHFLGYNPIREYRIGAELNRLPVRSISIDCENRLCLVTAEDNNRGYRFSFERFDELKNKVETIKAINKSWPESKAQCSRTETDEWREWCDV